MQNEQTESRSCTKVLREAKFVYSFKAFALKRSALNAKATIKSSQFTVESGPIFCKIKFCKF